MEKETSRIEAFSDGIFSVAITLLAIEIGVDPKGTGNGSNHELTVALIHLWPKYLAYVNSFASVLLMWMAHHQMFRLIRTANNRIMLFNGMLLLLIALVPFPTKTMGEFIETAAQRAAAVFYTGYSVLVCGSFVLLTMVTMEGNGKWLVPDGLQKIGMFKKKLMIGVGCYTIITAVAYAAPILGIILSIAMWVYWAASVKEKPSR